MLINCRLPDVHEGSEYPAESTNKPMLKIFVSSILSNFGLLSPFQIFGVVKKL